jgi:hypothetical protein
LIVEVRRERVGTRMKINFRERKNYLFVMGNEKEKNVERIPNTYEFCK